MSTKLMDLGDEGVLVVVDSITPRGPTKASAVVPIKIGPFFELNGPDSPSMVSDEKLVDAPDYETFGHPGRWRTVTSASSEQCGFSHITRAMDVGGGVLVLMESVLEKGAVATLAFTKMDYSLFLGMNGPDSGESE